MIITVTLNPAIDQTLVLPHFVAGDTNRVKSARFDPGGKGINVSKVIHVLGGHPLTTGFAPGTLGRYIEHTLAEAGISCDFLHTRGQTRTNITIVDEMRSIQTLISSPGPETDYRHFERLTERIRRHVGVGDWVVLAGSVPPGLPPTVYRDLILMVQRRGAKAVLDADGEALSASIEAQPYMIKVNRKEMERLVGHPLSDELSAVKAAESIRERGITVVVVTRGREGAIAVDNEGAWSVITPRIHTVSTVGAGDAFLGALVTTMSSNGSLYDGLRLGCAAGTATCLTPGTELGTQIKIDELLPKIKVHSLTEA